MDKNMTNEEKQLLLKDICARLPYGVKCNVGNIIVTLDGITENGEAFADGSYFDAYDMKPYLRSMPSMTDGDIHSLFNAMYPNLGMMWYEKETDLIRFRGADYNNKRFLHITLWFNKVYSLVHIDWLNAHHFDYRGLIKKGLALEAPEDMYKTE